MDNPAAEEPSVEFWENRLELPVAQALDDASSPDFMDRWIKDRKPLEVAMLLHLLGLPPDLQPRERRARLRERGPELARFVPAALFGLRKSGHATLDVARGCLDDADLEAARKDDGTHDKAALIFAILERRWPDLEKVFHLDKLHKAGFARMRLAKPPRRPARKLKDFLNGEEVLAVIRRYDAELGDRHVSELLQVIELRDSLLVFIRRPHQQGYVLADSRVVHGYTPDQIVLEFRSEAELLNIASHGDAASYDIANRIASAFYGQSWEYENITEETFTAQLVRFLRQLVTNAAHDLRLVQLRIDPSPLRGAPVLDVSNQDGVSIGQAITELQQAFSWSIDDIDRVPRFKALFNKKRVALKVEPIGPRASEDRRYVVRYRDQTLSLGERPLFERLIEQDHGIKIVSTEKRGARGRNA